MLFCLIFNPKKRPLVGIFFHRVKEIIIIYPLQKSDHQFIKKNLIYEFFSDFLFWSPNRVDKYTFLTFDLRLLPYQICQRKKKSCSLLVFVFSIQWHRFRRVFQEKIFWPPKLWVVTLSHWDKSLWGRKEAKEEE